LRAEHQRQEQDRERGDEVRRWGARRDEGDAGAAGQQSRDGPDEDRQAVRVHAGEPHRERLDAHRQDRLAERGLEEHRQSDRADDEHAQHQQALRRHQTEQRANLDEPLLQRRRQRVDDEDVHARDPQRGGDDEQRDTGGGDEHGDVGRVLERLVDEPLDDDGQGLVGALAQDLVRQRGHPAAHRRLVHTVGERQVDGDVHAHGAGGHRLHLRDRGTRA
jgi:hypothetical protein